MYGFHDVRAPALHLAGAAPFIHSQGDKAWMPRENVPSPSMRGRVTGLSFELSPYTVMAANLQPDAGWTRPQTRSGALLRTIGVRNPAVTGLPLAVVFDGIRFVNSLVKPRGRAVEARG